MPVHSWPFELKSLDETGVFEGYASVYNIVDQGGDKVLPGAFQKSLALQGRTRPLLADHKDVIGLVTLADSGSALVASGKLNLEVQRAREVLALMKQKAITGLSIGYQTVKDNFVNGVRELSELKLFEVSVVPFPMELEAQVTSVKAAQLGQIHAALADLKSSVTAALEKKGARAPERFYR
jgi:HK97 family phage prohead protease